MSPVLACIICAVPTRERVGVLLGPAERRALAELGLFTPGTVLAPTCIEHAIAPDQLERVALITFHQLATAGTLGD